jgi:hypothetical protein
VRAGASTAQQRKIVKPARKNPHALFLFYIVNHRYGEQRVTNQRGSFLRLKLYLLRSIFGRAIAPKLRSSFAFFTQELEMRFVIAIDNPRVQTRVQRYPRPPHLFLSRKNWDKKALLRGLCHKLVLMRLRSGENSCYLSFLIELNTLLHHRRVICNETTTLCKLAGHWKIDAP